MPCPTPPPTTFTHGKNDPAFRTKLQIGATLANAATTAGVKFRAVVADCAYGDHNTFRAELSDARLPFVMALKRGHGAWQYKDAFRPVDAARELAWYGPEQSGDWQPVTRTFRNGRTATWWAADARLGWWGLDGVIRLVVATTDPATLPETSTWYLATNLKDELGWADFQVRSDTAIRRHQTLVNCAFSFCWNTWFTPNPPPPAPVGPPPEPDAPPGRAERGRTRVPAAPNGLLAPGHPRRPRLADVPGHTATLLAGLDDQAPAHSTTGTDQHRRHRQTPGPLHPDLTNHR